MAGDVLRVAYVFHLGGGRSETIELVFSKQSLLLKGTEGRPREEWTDLGFHACRHCPLNAATSPACPFARALSAFIHRFDEFYSYEKAVIEVITPQRRVLAERPLQHGMASLIGLIGATSGCPHLAFFRPMARFHLPFATEEETLCRAFSFHLMGQYIHGGGDGQEPISLEGLCRHYEAAALVNQGMADRIRAAFTKDAVVNAIVILDTFAQAAPCVIEEKLDELRYIFDATDDEGEKPVRL